VRPRPSVASPRAWGPKLALPTGGLPLDRLPVRRTAGAGCLVRVVARPAAAVAGRLLASKLRKAEPGPASWQFPANARATVAADDGCKISAGGARALLGEQVDDLAEILRHALPVVWGGHGLEAQCKAATFMRERACGFSRTQASPAR